MNRYPFWKYLIMVVSVVLGVLYTAPNFFGHTPAVQISASKSTVKVTEALQSKIENTLANAHIPYSGIYFNRVAGSGSFKIRLSSDKDADAAKDALMSALNTNVDEPEYLTALSAMSSAPDWLTGLGASPMALGLDLQGGVHFGLQVEMKGAIEKRLDAVVNELSIMLKDKKIAVQSIQRDESDFQVVAVFNTPSEASEASSLIMLQNINLKTSVNGNSVAVMMTETALNDLRINAMKQNINTLHNRVAELGVSEPIIQQQGADRIVVELPGVKDSAKAKSLIGKTANLQIRLGATESDLSADTFDLVGGGTVRVKKQVFLTGDSVFNAMPANQEGQNVVAVKLDAAGGKAMFQMTGENRGKPMAMILFEQVRGEPKGEVISWAGINGQFGEDFIITGSQSLEEANDLAVLLRSGALAAPMSFVEESSVGPSLGAENIKKGFDSLKYGFLAISIFIILYYRFFGFISVVSLGINLLLLVGILSAIGETMTLPGIAAVALTLGMAIDSNVLINERIREELRSGYSPQQAIHFGYERAFATILDSNITTLIAGLALLIFGTGPIKGFAVVHCLGILTSMFSSVFFSRGLANLVYGRRVRLNKISIGQVWRADSTKTPLV